MYCLLFIVDDTAGRKTKCPLGIIKIPRPLKSLIWPTSACSVNVAYDSFLTWQKHFHRMWFRSVYNYYTIQSKPFTVFTHRSAQSFGFNLTVNGPFTQKHLENKGGDDIDSPEFHQNTVKMMKRCWTASLLGVTAHSRQTSRPAL